MKYMCLDSMYALLIDTCKLSAFHRFDWMEEKGELERSSDYVRQIVCFAIRLLDSVATDFEARVGKRRKSNQNDFSARMQYMDEQIRLFSCRFVPVGPEDEAMYEGSPVIEAQKSLRRNVTLQDDESLATMRVFPDEPAVDDEYMDRLINESKDENERNTEEKSSTP